MFSVHKWNIICMREFEYSKKRVKKVVFFITFIAFIIVINCENKFRRVYKAKNNKTADDIKATGKETGPF